MKRGIFGFLKFINILKKSLVNELLSPRNQRRRRRRYLLSFPHRFLSIRSQFDRHPVGYFVELVKIFKSMAGLDFFVAWIARIDVRKFRTSSRRRHRLAPPSGPPPPRADARLPPLRRCIGRSSYRFTVWSKIANLVLNLSAEVRLILFSNVLTPLNRCKLWKIISFCCVIEIQWNKRQWTRVDVFYILEETAYFSERSAIFGGVEPNVRFLIYKRYGKRRCINYIVNVWVI